MPLESSTLCVGCMAVQFSTGRSEKKFPWPHRETPAPSKSRSGRSKTKTLQIFRRHLVRRKTFSQEIKVTNWYQPLPSHQKVPEAAFPTREESKGSHERRFRSSTEPGVSGKEATGRRRVNATSYTQDGQREAPLPCRSGYGSCGLRSTHPTQDATAPKQTASMSQ